jgi:hypothetical protein
MDFIIENPDDASSSMHLMLSAMMEVEPKCIRFQCQCLLKSLTTRECHGSQAR